MFRFFCTALLCAVWTGYPLVCSASSTMLPGASAAPGPHCERCCHCTRVAPTHSGGKMTELEISKKRMDSFNINGKKTEKNIQKVLLIAKYSSLAWSIGRWRCALSIFGRILVPRYLTLTCSWYLRTTANFCHLLDLGLFF